MGHFMSPVCKAHPTLGWVVRSSNMVPMRFIMSVCVGMGVPGMAWEDRRSLPALYPSLPLFSQTLVSTEPSCLPFLGFTVRREWRREDDVNSHHLSVQPEGLWEWLSCWRTSFLCCCHSGFHARGSVPFPSAHPLLSISLSLASYGNHFPQICVLQVR